MRLFALFGLAFASASRERLTLPHTANSPAHSSKGTPSPILVAQHRLRLLVGSRFQVLFHSPPGVLFTFPSRYWFTIGRQGILRLTGWSPQIHASFHGPGATWDDEAEAACVSDTGLLPTPAGPFQGPSPTQQLGNSARGLVPPLFGHTTPRLQRRQAWHSHGLVSTLFARRYSGCRGCFPFLTVLRCFNSRGSLHRCYVFTPGYTLHDEWWVSPFGHLRIEA